MQKELLYIPFGIGICFRVKGGFWEGQAYVRFLEETYLLMDCVMVKSRENGELSSFYILLSTGIKSHGCIKLLLLDC